MQRNYFTVLFFLKKSKLLKNGEAPICMRITINGKRAEVQIKRSIDVTKWNTQKECAIGREKKYQEINHYLDTIRTKILQIHREQQKETGRGVADIPCGTFVAPGKANSSSAEGRRWGSSTRHFSAV